MYLTKHPVSDFLMRNVYIYNVDCANIMESTEYGIWHSILPEAVEEFGFQVEQRGDRSSPTEYK